MTGWLYGVCWTGTERLGSLFDRATAWLLAHKILLPGVSTLERFVVSVRARVEAHLYRLLTRGITGLIVRLEASKDCSVGGIYCAGEDQMLKQSPTFSTIRTPTSCPASHKRYLPGNRGNLRVPYRKIALSATHHSDHSETLSRQNSVRSQQDQVR